MRARGALAATLESEDGDIFVDGLQVTPGAKPEGGLAAGEAAALVKLAEAGLREVVKAWVAELKAPK